MPMPSHRGPRRTTRLLATALVLAAATAARATDSSTPAAPLPTLAPAPQRETVQVLATYPHDRGAFTQGLLLHNGALYESTGLYGRSSLRKVEIETGKVVQRVDLPPKLFGEGLTLFGDRLIQLTWQEHVAPMYALPTFEKVGQQSYPTEGWGLCFDGESLVMTDGSHRLYFRDPQTFALRRQIPVMLQGQPLPRVNELECVGDVIYANVWPTDRIVEIAERSGTVLATIDGSSLLSPEERKSLGPDAVLNGIAYDPRSETFLITGKLWPKLLRVRFVPE